MDTGNFQPDIFLDPLFILLDILECLLGRTTRSAVPVLAGTAFTVTVLSVLRIIAVVISLVVPVFPSLQISLRILLGISFLIPLPVLGTSLVSFLLRTTLAVTILVTAVIARLSSTVTVSAVTASRRLVSTGCRYLLIRLVIVLLGHSFPPIVYTD